MLQILKSGSYKAKKQLSKCFNNIKPLFTQIKQYMKFCLHFINGISLDKIVKADAAVNDDRYQVMMQFKYVIIRAIFFFYRRKIIFDFILAKF